MAAETVTIDVIANFRDKTAPGMDNAKSKADKLNASLEKTQKQIANMGKDKATVKLDAEDKASKKIENVSKKASALSKTNTKATLDATDKATSKISKVKSGLKAFTQKAHNAVLDAKDNASSKLSGVLAKAKDYGGKIYRATLGANDNAGGPIKTILNNVKGFAGKTFKATLSIVDKVTSPIKGIMNNIFSLKTIIAGVATGYVGKQLIADPISLADQLETANIGFETMFKSEQKAKDMMTDIQDFAAKTPFDTTGVVSSVQQMVRAGWSVDQVMGDMEKIGNAAAAAGQGTEGVQGIVLALQQMKMSGKLNAQDMMQLTNRGVKGWEYVAKAIGKTIPETRKLSEEGLIPVETAIDAIIDGMGEYDGMMDKMSNRTVKGIMSNLKDTFDIKIVSKWGKGLADGATIGLGKIADYLDEIDPLLSSAGSGLEELGAQISSDFFDVIEKGYKKLTGVITSEEFQNADGLFPKIKVAWDQLIAEPFGAWWDSKGYPWIVDKMSSLGEGLGTGLSSIFKGLLGVDVLDEATTIGGGFAKGFLEGFDGSGVWDALKQSIKDAFSDAFKVFTGEGDGSSWIKAALIAYGGLKLGGGLIGGFNTVAGMLGKQTLGKSIIGSAAKGSGVLGLGTKAATALGSGTFATGGMLGAGATSVLGLGAIGGGIAAGASLYSGGKDLARAFNADTSTELGKKEKSAYTKSGAKKIGGVATGAAAGAAIGSVVPVLGTAVGALLGAGIGGVAGWISSKNDIKEYEKAVKEAEEETKRLKISQEKAKYSSKGMKTAVKDLADGTITATEFQEEFNRAISENKASHFGDIKLSLQEISDVADSIVFDGIVDGLNNLETASADVDSSLVNLKNSSAKLERVSWKGSLGVKLDEGDITSYKESVDTYINNAKSYIEDKHYEFTAAVNILLSPEESGGMLDKANGVFAGLQEQLNSAGEELTAQVNLALEDGVITADEQGIISAAQAKVQEITDKISQAETEADFMTLKIKYSGADLDSESFSDLQEELAEKVESAMSSYDESLKVGIAGLQMQFNEGAISQDELDTGIQALADGYEAKVNDLQVKVEDFQFDTLAESYGPELEKALADSGLQGTTQEKLKQALQAAIDDGVEVASWSPETAAKYLGLDSLDRESAAAITEITSKIAQTIPEKLTEGISGVEAGEFTYDATPIAEGVKVGVDNAMGEVDMSGFHKTLAEKLSGGTWFEENPITMDYSPLTTSVQEGLNTAADSLNLETFSPKIIGKVQESINANEAPLDCAAIGTSVANGASTAIDNAPMDGINTSISTLKSNTGSAIDTAFGNGFNTSTTVTITAKYKLANPTASLSFSGGGSGSTTVKGSILSLKKEDAGNNATGNVVSGKQLSWLAEEGPEVVIPTVPSRRNRAIALWEKAGEMIGVGKHAKGGIIGGAFSKATNTSKASESPQTVENSSPTTINVGGVTIQVNTNGNSGDIVSQIKAKGSEITNAIAEMIADAVDEAYQNIPLAGN